MQNKSAIWVFTILLIAACVFQMSYTWVVNGVEREAAEEAQVKLDSLNQEQADLTRFQQDSALQRFENQILLNKGPEEVYPVFGFDYAHCKKREINLGLDLQGGMHVTLEVSVPGILRALAGTNQREPAFQQVMNEAREMQKSSTDDFVTLFGQAWNQSQPNNQMAAVFHNLETKDKIPADATNEEILAILDQEAEDAIKRTEQILRKRVDNLGVVQPKIQRLSGTGRIVVELPGVKDKSRVRNILQGTAKLEFFDVYFLGELFRPLQQANAVLAQSLPRVESKTDSATVETAPEESEAATLENSDALDALLSDEEDADVDTVLADSNDTNSNEELSLEELLDQNTEEATDTTDINESREQFRRENPLFGILQPFQEPFAASIGLSRVSDTALVNSYLKRKEIRRLFPPRIQFLWDAKPIEDGSNLYTLRAVKVPKNGKAELEGDVVTDARVSADEYGNPTVSMSMNSTGARIWREMTKRATEVPPNQPHAHVAVVLDGLIYSAPQVNNEINNGQTQITGRFTQQEAGDLAGVLKAGKLPAPSRIIEEAIVGPSLGQSSIESGWTSFLLALGLVLVYMIFYYSRAGIVANIALIANLFFIMGVLASLRATLTLPGIAGIVLTIGMSVDANVLIYERIREELSAGKGLRLAITEGYQKAYSSILDANITTLLTGIILATFGTGPIQGFATTLIIGILTSLFSAIFITRLLFEWQMGSSKNIPFSTKLTEGAFKNININFIGKRKLYYGISGIIIAAGLISLFTRGLNYGVDFTGGRSYIVRFEEPVSVTDIAQSLGDQFISEDGIRQVPEVKTFG
ncbi:MAG: protein translocase subunit SecD, partial [Leptolyngbya sp. SIO3F4]|nr:protein translocase subunit SecD [Leptolyngbya sp. SIO3F4]